MKKTYHLTEEGLKDLQAELDKLISRRPEIAEAIKMARELGDLSENDEYRSSKDEQEKNEQRITEINSILANFQIIKEKNSGGKVALGSTVKLKNNSQSKTFQIVGTVEADPINGKISDESPIGKQILGKSIGDEVQIVTPKETLVYKITQIN